MSVVFSQNIVLEKLQNLSINKSPGPDDINSRIVVELAKSAAPSLSVLCRTWCRGVVVITTAQLHSTKPEFRFCAVQILLAACQRFKMMRILGGC